MSQTATSSSAHYSETSPSHCLADKTLIIFDWDGTLMDSIGLIVESMHVAGEAHGFVTTDQAVQDIIGLSLANGIDELAGVMGNWYDYKIDDQPKRPQDDDPSAAAVDQ